MSDNSSCNALFTMSSEYISSGNSAEKLTMNINLTSKTCLHTVNNEVGKHATTALAVIA